MRARRYSTWHETLGLSSSNLGIICTKIQHQSELLPGKRRTVFSDIIV